MRRLFAGLVLCSALAAGCATTGGPHSGVVAFKSSIDEAVPPVSYAVGPGRVSGESLDATVEPSPGGECIRGTLVSSPLQLCAGKTAPDGTQSWSGSSGTFTVQPVEKGAAFRVSGFVSLEAGTLIDVTQVLRPGGAGRGWDELRAEPALLLLATTATDLRALRHHRRGL